MTARPARPFARRAAATALAALASALTAGAGAQIAFEAEPAFVECSVNHYPTRARLFDMDGDGRRDLVLPGRDRNRLLDWAPILPDGSFGQLHSLEVAGQTDDAAEADVDGDGVPELVLAIRSYAGRVQVLRRGADGLMQPRTPIAVDREPRSLVAGDFDGDGDADLAVTCYGSEQVTVLRNDGTGAFEVTQRIRLDPWAGGIPGPQDTRAADLDGDGRTDLVIGTIGTRRFHVLRGVPGGGFGAPVSWLAPSLAQFPGAAIVGFDLGDLDGDGDIDILSPMLATGGTQPLVAFVNDGSAGFAQRDLVGTVTGQVGYHWTAAVSDLDGDGRPDAITSTALPGAVVVWRNVTSSGPVTFQPAWRLDYSSFARDILCANVDGDCDPDALIADIGGHYALGYRNLRACLAGGGPPGARVAGRAAADRDPGGGPAAPPVRAASLPASLAGASPAEIAAWLATAAGMLPDAGGRTFRASDTPSCAATGGSGPCDEVHSSPGCFTTPCCEAVCAIVASCCEVTWDQVCVDLARTDCDGLPCPSYGGCESIHDDPGCDDPECCARVCPLDGYCEGATWDRVCVERAAELCGLPPCTVTVPAGAADEGEPCYKRLNDGATRNGEEQAIACGQVFTGTCTSGSPRDTDWYALGGGSRHRITLTVDAEFPLEVHLMRGPISGPLETAGSYFGGRCSPVVIDRCVEGGPWHAVVTLGQSSAAIRSGQACTDPDPENPPPPDDPLPEPGFDGIRYWLRLDCAGCAVPGDLDGDGRVSGSDLGLLLGAWGGRGIADLNGDGVVSGSDLGLLLGAWTGP